MNPGWIRGDHTGLEFPMQSESLRAGAQDFLTRAFHTAGALPADNSVTRITGLEQTSGGSTGHKAHLAVQYARPGVDLHTDLFVKFSRAPDDALRDQAKVQMELEVAFALLSRSPGFPITVPVCYFADYHSQSGTGILITERIAYNSGCVEPHYPKCLDRWMPDQPGHYAALIRSLARLAGAHKAGRLPPSVEDAFQFDLNRLVVTRRGSYTAAQIGQRVARYADFAVSYPQLVPGNLRSHEFLNRFAAAAPRLQELEPRVRQVLQSQPDMVALCHWNAHVDNAWFWRAQPGGLLECGLLDWGNVSQMNVAMAIWGCLSGAELLIWDKHLDELLNIFALEFAGAGGPSLDVMELKKHLILYTAMMGLTWLLDVPQYLLAKIPALAEVQSRHDSRIEDDERCRAQLTILLAFLNLWDKTDMHGLIEQLTRLP